MSPFGGEILCHDVVEAGLLRRAGWHVWMLPSLGESYEALPANMVDFAQRERRWCQGNLQHLGVLPTRGLRPVGRYHLALGVLNYLSGPLLVAFVALIMVDPLVGGRFAKHLLDQPGWARTIFVSLTFLLLYAAKLCSLIAALADDKIAARFGGRVRMLISAALEQAAVMVTAPVLLVFYTRFIIMMLLGRAVQWDAQPRDDRGVSWAEALHRMRVPFMIGLVWLVAASALGGATWRWSATLLPGLLLAVPFAVWTSYRTLGVAARRMGLFLTEDEVAPQPDPARFQPRHRKRGRIHRGPSGCTTAFCLFPGGSRTRPIVEWVPLHPPSRGWRWSADGKLHYEAVSDANCFAKALAAELKTWSVRIP